MKLDLLWLSFTFVFCRNLLALNNVSLGFLQNNLEFIVIRFKVAFKNWDETIVERL